MPELRHDPIQKRWVIIASERGHRPMDFAPQNVQPQSEASCPFCPGHESLTPNEILAFRAVGGPNGPGWGVRVVPNRFPALMIEGELGRAAVGQYDRINGIGAHEVIIETPEHHKSLAELSPAQIALVLRAYRDRLADLMKDMRFKYIVVFKNHGPAAGASLQHSHSQLIATPVTPRTVAIELSAARDHFRLKERCIFCDILAQEIETRKRIVAMGPHYVTICPYASRFPFEMMLLPRRHQHDFSTLPDEALNQLAHHLKDILLRMNKSLGNPSYNFLLHTSPNSRAGIQRAEYWKTLEADFHWHIEILPRLTNVAGFEWGTGFYINPTPPEEAATYMREVRL